MKLPTVSIIIPTYMSEKIIGICLGSVTSQNYPSDRFEASVVDNFSTDRTVEVAREFGARVYLHGRNACEQRNFGAQNSNGEYLLFLDHDMQMSRNLLMNFAQVRESSSRELDAWYIPERIVGGSGVWSTIRTFERSFYDGTVVDAARMVSRTAFDRAGGYDTTMIMADWDLDNELKRLGYEFGKLDECVFHHEEHLSLRDYLGKKEGYARGTEDYKTKWRSKDSRVYDLIVTKQYSAYYRLLGVFIEEGKWKRLIANLHLWIGVLFLRILVGLAYLWGR